MTVLRNQANLTPIRKSLRRNQTEAERKTWNILRNRQILGLKFFRQYGIGKFILDFYCPEMKLAIEIDGGQHNETQNRQADEARTHYLRGLGIKVIRFWNNEILLNPEGVYDKILQIINSLKFNSSKTSSLKKRRGLLPL
ncbi:MAG: endonuclease domain-containing protein [Patescibacteria group bacterium]